jgi:phosphoserine phosphatase
LECGEVLTPVRLLFLSAGAYAGFNPDAATSRSGGKAKVLGMIREEGEAGPVVMVGDGATDMEARPPADAFVGFGGVVTREEVLAGADWFVREWGEVLELLRR